MKIMETSARLLNPFLDELSDEFYLQILLKHVEKCGRFCYLSEPKDPEGSTDKFIRMLIKNGHESPLEHGGCTFKIVTDRAIRRKSSDTAWLLIRRNPRDIVTTRTGNFLEKLR